MLSYEFSRMPMSFIETTLNTARHLFPAYRVLEEAERTWDDEEPTYFKLRHPRRMKREYREEDIKIALRTQGVPPHELLAMRELQVARRERAKADEKRQAKRQAELEEEENLRIAIAEGTMTECGCCFDEYPLNRMIHCKNEEPHWFCSGCAKQTAVIEIGNAKYELKCMSVDGCEYGFSRGQKSRFLDEKTLMALDRNEQEANLRTAGLENLARCPFCPFAAEYPPVEQDRLFRCQNPDCEQVTCRLCKLESHIPKSCEENAKDIGFTVRRQIEEAMSAAMIRKCNGCGIPFVKQVGCNRMTCPTKGCDSVQCYACSKPCEYGHFDKRDVNGNLVSCPLHDSVEERHEQEVTRAEREQLGKVLAENPEYSEEDLKIKVSEEVKKSEEKRRERDISLYR
jgi:E3 ubiquitin-protein ligase RNF216